MAHYEPCNLHVGDCTSGTCKVDSTLAIVEEESMTFYRLDKVDDLLALCEILNEG